MKKNILKSTIVLTLVGVVCGLLIGLTNLITAPIIEKNQLAIAQKAYEGFFPNLDNIEITEVTGEYVYEYIKIFEGEEVIGHAFKGKGTNQRGLIDLVIAADIEGEIIGVKILSTENTPGFYDLYEQGSNKYLIGVNGNTLNDVTGIDNIGGATQTGDLLSAILKEVGEIASKYVTVAPVEINHYATIFGEGAVGIVDESFTGNEIVIEKAAVNDAAGNLLGYAYTGTVTVVDTIPYSPSAKLVLLVGVDKEGNVVGATTIESGHTPGFYNKYEESLNNLTDFHIDSIAKSTLSGNVIKEILEAIKEVILNE